MNSKNTSKKFEEKKRPLKNLTFAIIIFAALVALIWLSSHLLDLYHEHHLASRNTLYLNIQIFLATISSVLLIFLLSHYLEKFLKFRTEFTLGFVILALVLLAHSITSNPFFFSYFGYPPMEGPFSIIPLIFTAIAALALLYLNSK